jgi:phage shock protein PspC (stress-responsive transcriptional regulator)
MNKTININLGGVFFHIDEIAYRKLKMYLEAIRRSLSDDPKGRDEIITDIEARIGELLSEKVKDVRQVINEADIDEVVEVMGKPEDYMVDDEVFSDDDYRSQERRKTKKLYRDGDDKFLGGVSSGMAHYLNVDVIWIRIAWLVAAFGFGFGFIAYIIMWILLPEAGTTAEKLEMEGEPVNISNIEKKIRDEITQASERVKNGIDEVTDKVKKADYKKYGSKARSGTQDFVETLGKILTTFFLVIGKFIGVLLLIISVATIVGLLIGLFTIGSLDFIHEDWFYQNTMVYNNSGLPIWLISVMTFILVGIPFFFLFSLGLRILSNNTKTIGKTAKLSLFGIWIVALLSTIFFGTRQYMQTAYDGSVIDSHEITYVESDTLSLKLVDNNNLSDHGILKRRWGYSLVYDENDTERIYSNNIRLNVYTSSDDKFYIKTRKKSQGESRTAARENAEMIDFDFQLIEGELKLDGYFLADADNKFREQKIYVDLYIPINKTVYLDKSTRTFLYDVENIHNIYDRDMAEHYFRMTAEGLTCLDCEGYEFNTTDNAESFKMQIDKSGVHIEIQDEGNEKAEVNIDENGILIKSSKDSI